jgi:hypothetical protein
MHSALFSRSIKREGKMEKEFGGAQPLLFKGLKNRPVGRSETTKKQRNGENGEHR